MTDYEYLFSMNLQAIVRYVNMRIYMRRKTRATNV